MQISDDVNEQTLLALRIGEAKKEGYLDGLDDAILALRAREMHDAADEIQALKKDSEDDAGA